MTSSVNNTRRPETVQHTPPTTTGSPPHTSSSVSVSVTPTTTYPEQQTTPTCSIVASHDHSRKRKCTRPKRLFATDSRQTITHTADEQEVRHVTPKEGATTCIVTTPSTGTTLG